MKKKKRIYSYDKMIPSGSTLRRIYTAFFLLMLFAKPAYAGDALDGLDFLGTLILLLIGFIVVPVLVVFVVLRMRTRKIIFSILTYIISVLVFLITGPGIFDMLTGFEPYSGTSDTIFVVIFLTALIAAILTLVLDISGADKKRTGKP